MSDCVEIRKEFVIRIVMCLIELRAVKEFVRRISKWRFWVNCNVTD